MSLIRFHASWILEDWQGWKWGWLNTSRIIPVQVDGGSPEFIAREVCSGLLDWVPSIAVLTGLVMNVSGLLALSNSQKSLRKLDIDASASSKGSRRRSLSSSTRQSSRGKITTMESIYQNCSDWAFWMGLVLILDIGWMITAGVPLILDKVLALCPDQQHYLICKSRLWMSLFFADTSAWALSIGVAKMAAVALRGGEDAVREQDAYETRKAGKSQNFRTRYAGTILMVGALFNSHSFFTRGQETELITKDNETKHSVRNTCGFQFDSAKSLWTLLLPWLSVVCYALGPAVIQIVSGIAMLFTQCLETRRKKQKLKIRKMARRKKLFSPPAQAWEEELNSEDDDDDMSSPTSSEERALKLTRKQRVVRDHKNKIERIIKKFLIVSSCIHVFFVAPIITATFLTDFKDPIILKQDRLEARASQIAKAAVSDTTPPPNREVDFPSTASLVTDVVLRTFSIIAIVVSHSCKMFFVMLCCPSFGVLCLTRKKHAQQLIDAEFQDRKSKKLLVGNDRRRAASSNSIKRTAAGHHSGKMPPKKSKSVDSARKPRPPPIGEKKEVAAKKTSLRQENIYDNQFGVVSAAAATNPISPNGDIRHQERMTSSLHKRSTDQQQQNSGGDTFLLKPMAFDKSGVVPTKTSGSGGGGITYRINPSTRNQRSYSQDGEISPNPLKDASAMTDMKGGRTHKASASTRRGYYQKSESVDIVGTSARIHHDFDSKGHSVYRTVVPIPIDTVVENHQEPSAIQSNELGSRCPHTGTRHPTKEDCHVCRVYGSHDGLLATTTTTKQHAGQYV